MPVVDVIFLVTLLENYVRISLEELAVCVGRLQCWLEFLNPINFKRLLTATCHECFTLLDQFLRFLDLLLRFKELGNVKICYVHLKKDMLCFN